MGTSEVAAFSPFTFCPGTVIVGRLSPYTVKPGSGCGPIANGNFTPETAPTGKLKGVSRPIGHSQEIEERGLCTANGPYRLATKQLPSLTWHT
jgi:hypothetical protein